MIQENRVKTIMFNLTMIFMRRFLLLLLLFTALTTEAQNDLRTKFYDVKLPLNTTVKPFASSDEEVSNSDVYQFLVNNKTKYLCHFLSNKLFTETDVNFTNFTEFLVELNEIIIDNAADTNNGFKVNFHYDDKNVRGIAYLLRKKNILHRFVFMFPNEIAENKFKAEADDIVRNIVYLKNEW